MFKAKWSKLTERLCERPRMILLLVLCLLVLTLYIVTGRELEFENFLSPRVYNVENDRVDGYLVWNRKCRMKSYDPMHPSIKKFVKRAKFEACSSEPLMSYITRDPSNGSMALVINQEVMKARKNTSCCWTPIVRRIPSRPPKEDCDSKIRVGKCQNFVNRAVLPPDLEIAMITCRNGKKTIYENIHSVINPAKVQKRWNQERSNESGSRNSDGSTMKTRKLSVLILGIDNVSRLNFKRSLPKTERHLRDTDWFELRGYNKIAENTYPNLMAILTGQNSSTSYTKCAPTKLYRLDNCPMLWYNYRNASYITAYGEDLAEVGTFNYLKVGFVEPPTDYYLRPYILATEKRLKIKKRFNNKYCTGPELSAERIFNNAIEFARAFMGSPYFGFFWTNTVSHGDVNGVSSMDDRLEKMFLTMERDGILNDTMVVFLSDHGMRYGDIRKTFVGWYEERLPFIYVRLPDWFRDDRPDAYRAMRVNENRLTSPYDLYETLRDILVTSGGEAGSSSGCTTCQTLFRHVPHERGCSEAGISPHWCTCTAFQTDTTSGKIAIKGAGKFLEYVENIIKHYRDKKGKRLCSKLKLKKIHHIEKVIDPRSASDDAKTTIQGYFYLIEVTPGGALYEMTMRYHGGDNFTINGDDISRTNSYARDSKCIDDSSKRYCHCVGK